MAPHRQEVAPDRLARGIGAATGFGFERFYNNKSLRESQHAAIQNFITGAIGVAVFG